MWRGMTWRIVTYSNSKSSLDLWHFLPENQSQVSILGKEVLMKFELYSSKGTHDVVRKLFCIYTFVITVTFTFDPFTWKQIPSKQFGQACLLLKALTGNILGNKMWNDHTELCMVYVNWQNVSRCTLQHIDLLFLIPLCTYMLLICLLQNHLCLWNQ